MNILGFGNKNKKTPKKTTPQRVETPAYVTKDDVKKQVESYLREKELREHRKILWNNLSKRQKIKVLNYLAAKRRINNG